MNDLLKLPGIFAGELNSSVLSLTKQIENDVSTAAELTSEISK